MSLFIWFQFALVCTIGAMSPGPSLAVVIRNNINYNRYAGIMTSIGHGLGIGVYAALAVLGLGFILQTNQTFCQKKCKNIDFLSKHRTFCQQQMSKY